MRLPLKLNLSLINLFREFKNSASSFSTDFLKAVKHHLAISKSKVSSEVIKKISAQFHTDVEYLIIAIHVAFSKIANLNEFITILDPSFQLSPLNTDLMNRTNIFNKVTLHLALQKFSLDHSSELKDSVFLEHFTVELLMDITEEIPKGQKDVVYIPLSLINLSLHSPGLIDINLYCYICDSLNKAYSAKHLSLHPWIFPNAKLVSDFSELGLANIKSYMSLRFSQKDLEAYIQIVSSSPGELGPLREMLPELETLLFYSVHFQNAEINSNLERLFIALLGHPHIEVRNRATLFLNVLYDKMHWEFRGALKAKVASVGDPFKIECLVESEPEDSCFAVALVSFSFEGNSKEEVLSWHIPKVTPYQMEEDFNTRTLIISMDLGAFPRTGFYDWKLMKFQRGGKIASVYTGFSHAGSLSTSIQKLETIERGNEFIHNTKAIQGRYIVHPKDINDMQIHEIVADYPEGLPTEKYRGTFARIAEMIPGYARSGINALYVMGVYERDNNLVYGEDGRVKAAAIRRRKESSPLAITNRMLPNTLLGGEKGLKLMIQAAKQKGVKIIVDFTTRIGSSKFHKKYLPYMLSVIDPSGKRVPFFGSDGRGWAYDDTAILNFRKKETWDFLIQETVEFIRKFDIDGIQIDNAETVPQYFQLNVEELTRRENDGEPSYTREEIFYGNVIIPNTESGYWTTDYQQSFANPFYVKLCKTLWQNFPNLIIIGDVIGGQNLEGREENIARSGIIPRLYRFAPVLASIYGQHLHRDGSISNTEKQSVNSLRSWYESVRKDLPSGSIVIQSTTSHAFPYPAFLFRRATWSVIDLFFYLPDLPMTFLGEEDGHAFRTKTVNNFRNEVSNKSFQSPSSSARKKMISKSSADLNKVLFDTFDEIKLKESVIESHSMSERATLEEIVNGDNQIAKEAAPEYGFDLKKIRLHYEHRRKLRHEKAVLRDGKLIPLLAEHAGGFHAQVLSFARIRRKDPTQMAIVAINFNNHNVYFHLNLKNLRYILDEIDQKLDKAVIKIEDWVGTTVNDYYTIYEFLYGRIETCLKPHASLVWGASLIFDDDELYQKTIQCSIARIQTCIMKDQPIRGNEIASLLYHSVKDANKISEFLNNFGYILKTYLIPNEIIPIRIFNLIEEFKQDPSLSGKLYAFCQAFKEENEKLGIEQQKELKPVIQSINQMLDYNKLGSIVFVCPELGRWSTQGGLGVMVDELSQGLVLLGEDVICISPYYERNRKGETGYLEKDPDGIKYAFNIEVFLDGKYVIGVHHGVVKGVKVYFLHNPYAFPSAYADGDARYTIQQLAIMGKATMELLCYIKCVPSVVVTNDWFTGLVPAYVKNGHFSDTFKETKFFHVVHNLEPIYEGRIYLQPHEGTYDFIHKLPTYLFVDPYWKDIAINPSRCAIMSSDQWGTVSENYKEDLLRTSPLSSILASHPKPFGFPNGIPKEVRLEKMREVCNNDRALAKGLLQKKYFGFEQLDDSYIIFGFIGRITQQKGVHLILESVEQLITKYNWKPQFIIGGAANLKEPYGSYCAGMMEDLAKKYPKNFWSAPNDFYTDGALLTAGSDFGLMPSLFEPGGIVQHEFFVAGTPVIAFRTGGLKDTVKEFEPKTRKGNGFCFEDHKLGDFVYAVERAIAIYKHKELLTRIRKNAYESTIDVSDVSRAWLKEFYRICGKSFIDPAMVENHKKAITRDWDPSKYVEKLTIKRLEQEVSEHSKLRGLKYQTLFLQSRGNAKKIVFKYQTTKLPRPKVVAVVGSFNNWKTIYPMHYDPLLNKWNVTLNLQPGEYYYKFVVDDKWICSDDDPKINDIDGNINNYLIVNK